MHTQMKSIFKRAKKFDSKGGPEDVKKLVQEIESLFDKKKLTSKCQKFAKKVERAG